MSSFDSGTDYDSSILLPNRYKDYLRAVDARCPCGASASVRDGFLETHFPVEYEGRPLSLSDPYLPGTSACRYSGRSVTLESALRRDAELTLAESFVRDRTLARLMDREAMMDPEN